MHWIMSSGKWSITFRNIKFKIFKSGRIYFVKYGKIDSEKKYIVYRPCLKQAWSLDVEAVKIGVLDYIREEGLHNAIRSEV